MHGRLSAFIVCLILLFSTFTTLALSDSAPSDTAEYVGGGVLWRETARTRALIDELNVAYLDFDMPYMVKGEQAEWRVNATGGDGVYKYAFYLYYSVNADTSGFYGAAARPASSDPVFQFTTDKTQGHYMLEIEVSDTMGNKLRWQSQIFEVFSGETDDETTVAGKVRALARECIASAGASDYDRALWLHDWLIYNANYDYTFTNYFADGVLLRGTGVCQSYAYAYDMLLKEVGIDCIYITGFAGDFSDPGEQGDYHGWNLVKMDGEWYHVDCTWDDPNSGGAETHTYFGMTDEMISKDHRWTRDEKGVVPECSSTDLTYVLIAGCIPVNGVDSFTLALDEMADNRYAYGDFMYMGSDASVNLFAAARDWLQSDALPDGAGYSLSGSDSRVVVTLFFGGGVDLTRAQQARIFESAVTVYEGETYALKVSTLPEGTNGAGLAWSSANTDIADVSNGVITAKSAGETTVSATCQSNRRYDVSVLVMPSDVFVIPDGVMSIEAEAFAECKGLTSVRIPDTVTYIAPDAFSGSPITVIICGSGTFAEDYAEQHNIDCITIE